MNETLLESPRPVRPSWKDSSALVVAEATRAVEAIAPGEAERLLSATTAASRVFILGQGRSGIALRALAMRLMHLGLRVHVVGDATAPAIAAGDLLLIASGSGRTPSVLTAARSAIAAGAEVAGITAAPHSPLASLTPTVLVVPAAAKRDRSGQASAQYAGSLFEQVLWLLGDGLFHALWQRSGLTADELWARHSNLE
ncbi:6-phospho-3-hexuloisomerase [Streptomyces mexicanus]|uniref:6-phospho-3-hexuloisomerase n=1 Tax=Streptomyces mexicanus TaxID=178566 RepID=UPI0013580F72|nr:6-phospho-3-hexuloisomerase [Streptomyces mexicanus]